MVPCVDGGERHSPLRCVLQRSCEQGAPDAAAARGRVNCDLGQVTVVREEHC